MDISAIHVQYTTYQQSMKHIDAKSIKQVIIDKAEKLLRKKTTGSKSTLSNAEILKLIHELEVQKIDLQAQNEEYEQALGLLNESEEKFRQLFENMTAGFALHEIVLNAEGKPCDFRFLEINSAFEQLTGLKSINLIGKTTLEVLPNTEPYWIEIYGQVALTGKAINFENYSRELGKHFQVNAYSPEPGKFVTIFLDITERKQHEEQILLSNSTIKREQLQNEALINSTTDLI